MFLINWKVEIVVKDLKGIKTKEEIVKAIMKFGRVEGP